MLNRRGLDTVRISKVKGHADDAMVLHGQVRRDDRLGNDAADEAADFGRRRVSPAVIDARRNLSGVCGRWYSFILVLHRFFIAIARAVVNHDDLGGTAPNPGPPGIWHSEWFQLLLSVLRILLFGLKLLVFWLSGSLFKIVFTGLLVTWTLGSVGFLVWNC